MASEEKTAFGLAIDKGVADRAAKDAAKAAKAGGPIPKLMRPMDLEAMRKGREQLVSDTRSFLGQIGDIIADWVKFVRQMFAMPPDERSAYREDLKHGENVILSYLGLNPGDDAAQEVKDNFERARKNPLLTGAAKLHYALTMTDTCPPKKQAVFDLVGGNNYHRLPGLVQLGLLQEVSGEAPKNVTTVEVFGTLYQVNGKREDAAKLAGAIEKACDNAFRTGRQFYRDKLDEIRGEATEEYALADLLPPACKPGRLSLFVPDETRMVDEKKEGKKTGNKIEKFYPGGTVLVESDGAVVKIVRGIGHFQRIVTEIAEAGRFLQVRTLTEDQMNLGKRVDSETFRHLIIMHSILRRGIVAEQERVRFHKECDVEAAELSRKASVMAEAWLLDSAQGTALVGLTSWTVEDREKDTKTKYPRAHFLVERNADGHVRVVEYPERLKPLFGDLFAEFMDPKDRFEGLKYPLGAILRKTWAIAQADQESRAQTDEQEGQRRFAEGFHPPADEVIGDDVAGTDTGK